jgi:RND family efflux transporter MFP subunit
VRVVTPQQSDSQQLVLSGVVKAEIETPLAFQVGGRVQQRLVNAGANVTKGQALMLLDPQDLQQQLQAEKAALDAAVAEQQVAAAELRRIQQLVAQQLVSEQLNERAELVLTQAQKAVAARAAALTIAEQALDYAQLTAPANGVVIHFAAEQDQVVNRGQTVALLAHDGARDIDVLVPPMQAPAAQAELSLGDISLPLSLRETAGAVSESGRTLRARYRVQGELPLPLNSVVKVRFNSATAASWVVPLSALDGRCSDANESLTACPLQKGAQVWRVRDGEAHPLAVKVLRVDGEYAYIDAALNTNEMIISTGTHRLIAGAKVRVLPQ